MKELVEKGKNDKVEKSMEREKKEGDYVLTDVAIGIVSCFIHCYKKNEIERKVNLSMAVRSPNDIANTHAAIENWR